MLGLNVPFKHKDVRKAFRTKARLFHPDRHTDPVLQKKFSLEFIKVKQASDLLMALPESSINSVHSNRDRSVKRKSDRSFREKKINHPLFYELDNLVSLFNLVKKSGTGHRSFKKIKAMNFYPSEWLGRWYVKFIETAYPGEEHLSGASFFLLRSFKLIFGLIILIISFIGISLAGIAIAVLLGPPFLFFLGFYFLFNQGMIFLKRKVSEFNKNSSVNKVNKIFFVLKGLFLSLFLIFFISFSGVLNNAYIIGITWVLAVLIFMVFLSSMYDLKKTLIKKDNSGQ